MQRFTKAMAAVIMTAVICVVGCKSKNLSSGVKDSHEYVDLGLPSGTMWATCNIGADKPEDYGNYYAWGETETKITYNWSTYKYGDDFSLTKYCNLSFHGANGFTDNLTTLQLGDDPAAANWGGGWCTPTKEQWEELQDKTTSKWTKQNGVRGRLFTASNGNSIFLPAAGSRDNEPVNVGRLGYYWSSTLGDERPSVAWYFSFQSDGYFVDYYGRCDGRSVRAVHSSR